MDNFTFTLKESGHGTFYDIIPEIFCRDYGLPREICQNSRPPGTEWNPEYLVYEAVFLDHSAITTSLK
jgi:hypothetical protein